MTAAATMLPDSVYLVGSIGLDSTDEIFRTVGKLLGRRLKRVPDGEVGPRRLWATFQYPLLRSSPFLQPDPSGALRATSNIPLLALADGVTADEIRFGELGYAREARASYLDLQTAKKRGDFPEDVRLQVCMPTPFGVIYAFGAPKDVVEIEKAYEKAMIAEVRALCDAIPHEHLCIQWDFCHEMIALDGQPQTWFPSEGASQNDIMARMKRICAQVPDDVELGIHICYGDFGAKHYFEPKDAGRMVDVTNDIARVVDRHIDYVHFPVPVNRTDREYFMPFKDLTLDPKTEIYLGLVHLADGVDGVIRRIETAREFVPRFGIATECGIARARKPDIVHRILETYAGASRDLS
jgi:methionine synthase II (cobalamin-independent)